MKKEAKSISRKLKRVFPEYDIKVYQELGYYEFEDESMKAGSIRSFYSFSPIRKINISDIIIHVGSEIEEENRFFEKTKKSLW